MRNRPAAVSLAVLAATSSVVDAFVPSVSRRPSSLAVPPKTATHITTVTTKTAIAAPTVTNKSLRRGRIDATRLSMVDPSFLDPQTVSSFLHTTSQTLAFSDQGQNLAGVFFQASLLPYLAFLLFLGYERNSIDANANFGFQFVLLFVLATIPSGIISKLTYGTSLANVDWLHGGAEWLLTAANILIVLGLKESSTNPKPPTATPGRLFAFGSAAVFAAACVMGPQLGFEAHTPFLAGIGDLPIATAENLPWVSHIEPENALSVPTWAIHFSSVIEYLIAMGLVWRFSEVTGNEKWKGLTWGMLPLHASGICACTYHFFYNPASLQFLVTMQAGFTLLGNLTCAIAAYRIAASNGWNVGMLNPFEQAESSSTGLSDDGAAAMALTLREPEESNAALAAKVVGLTVFLSYAVKYGELGLDLPFSPNAPVALAMVLGIPGVTALYYYQKSQEEGGLAMPNFFGDKSLSMDDVKKYGVSGTVAYVLTELAFWAVAFPVASNALYQSTGHWPDVVNDAVDRAAVLGFIFAGANIARALVPLRLGAALALAPWVDENIVNRQQPKQS